VGVDRAATPSATAPPRAAGLYPLSRILTGEPSSWETNWDVDSILTGLPKPSCSGHRADTSRPGRADRVRHRRRVRPDRTLISVGASPTCGVSGTIRPELIPHGSSTRSPSSSAPTCAVSPRTGLHHCRQAIVRADQHHRPRRPARDCGEAVRRSRAGQLERPPCRPRTAAAPLALVLGDRQPLAP